MGRARVLRKAAIVWAIGALATLDVRAGTASPADGRGLEELPTQWAVIPALVGASDEQATVVRGFLKRHIAEAFPQIEYAGDKGNLGLVFKLRQGSSPAEFATLHKKLDRVPGVMGATPLPTASEMLRAKARAVVRGGPGAVAAGLIVRFREEGRRKVAKAGGVLALEDLKSLERTAGMEITGSRPMSGEAHVLDFRGGVDVHSAELAAKRLELDPGIESASVNGYLEAALVPGDPLFNTQWNLGNTAGGINVGGAWDVTTGSSGVVVAIVDSGVLPHPEFSGRLLPGYDFITSPANSNDGDGRDSNASDSGDWRVAGECGAGIAARNSTWHGTHVAGMIGAAGNNGIGIAGINWKSRLLPVRVLGTCGGTRADIIDGLRWAAGLPVPGAPTNPTPAQVINMSLGGVGNCLTDTPEYQSAILEALARGASVVVSAGNENEPALTRVPASCVGTIKVAATGPTGDRTAYSNYSRAIEIAAPGGDFRFGSEYGILSTYATGSQSDPGSATWGHLQGTSMAAPHVAGIASLALSLNPNLTVAQVRDVLRATSRDFPAGTACRTSGDCGFGIVDATAAIRFVPQITQPINFSDLWWVPKESGWGVNFQQQGNILFGTWFTYGADNQGVWFVMPSLTRVAEDFFVGDIFQTTGTPFNLINGAPALGTLTKVGSAVVAFFGVGLNLNPGLSDFDSAIFYFTDGTFEGYKPIGRQIFSTPTVCAFVSGGRTALTNYQDLWWNPTESGWGINLTHQGDIIFATWFTYGANGQGIWLVGSNVARTGPGTYSGRLYQTTGIALDRINGAQSVLSLTDVGSLSLTFANGEEGRMDYVLNGVAGSKEIRRQVFSAPVSACGPMN